MERAAVLFRIEGARQGSRSVADKVEDDRRGDGSSKFGGGVMTLTMPKSQRCAIYTRVSTDNGLEQEFNSLQAQREASEAYVKSQAHEGWKLLREKI